MLNPNSNDGFGALLGLLSVSAARGKRRAARAATDPTELTPLNDVLGLRYPLAGKGPIVVRGPRFRAMRRRGGRCECGSGKLFKNCCRRKAKLLGV